MKYRSRTEIASRILDAANSSSTKTRIMYKAFLSYAQLKEYLEMLTVNGLLEYQQTEETYKTTLKGRKFMELYDSMGELVVDSAELAKARR